MDTHHNGKDSPVDDVLGESGLQLQLSQSTLACQQLSNDSRKEASHCNIEVRVNHLPGNVASSRGSSWQDCRMTPWKRPRMHTTSDRCEIYIQISASRRELKRMLKAFRTRTCCPAHPDLPSAGEGGLQWVHLLTVVVVLHLHVRK